MVCRLIEPWLKMKKRPDGGREYKKLPKDMKKLDGLYVTFIARASINIGCWLRKC